jgi:hypothetical protein
VISYRTYKSPPLAIAADDPTVLYIRWYRYYIAGIAHHRYMFVEDEAHNYYYVTDTQTAFHFFFLYDDLYNQGGSRG